MSLQRRDPDSRFSPREPRQPAIQIMVGLFMGISGVVFKENAFWSHYREELRRKPFSFLISFCAILFFIVFLSARHSAGVVPPNEKRLVCHRRSFRPPSLLTPRCVGRFIFCFMQPSHFPASCPQPWLCVELEQPASLLLTRPLPAWSGRPGDRRFPKSLSGERLKRMSV